MKFHAGQTVYFSDAVRYMKAAEVGMNTPSLFDLLEESNNAQEDEIAEVEETVSAGTDKEDW